MDSFTLKSIALITMLIDHIGYVFFPECYILRFIGRIAFPIYAFLLIQGFLHTRKSTKLKKYIQRMFIFALISEVSFDLCFYEQPFYPAYQNVYFTLFLGLMSLYFYEYLESKNKDGFYSIILFCAIAFLLKTDYNVIGTIYFFSFYFIEKAKENKKSIKFQNMLYFILIFVIALFEIVTSAYDLTIKAIWESFKQYSWVYLGLFLSIIPISLYNGKLGYKTKTTQFVFYWFYPIHITVIYLIYNLIKIL